MKEIDLSSKEKNALLSMNNGMQDVLAYDLSEGKILYCYLKNDKKTFYINNYLLGSDMPNSISDVEDFGNGVLILTNQEDKKCLYDYEKMTHSEFFQSSPEKPPRWICDKYICITNSDSTVALFYSKFLSSSYAWRILANDPEDIGDSLIYISYSDRISSILNTDIDYEMSPRPMSDRPKTIGKKIVLVFNGRYLSVHNMKLPTYIKDFESKREPEFICENILVLFNKDDRMMFLNIVSMKSTEWLSLSRYSNESDHIAVYSTHGPSKAFIDKETMVLTPWSF